MTFEEMCKARDPLYAAMEPNRQFAIARSADARALVAAENGHMYQSAKEVAIRGLALLVLTIPALRNQDEPYYHV